MGADTGVQQNRGDFQPTKREYENHIMIVSHVSQSYPHTEILISDGSEFTKFSTDRVTVTFALFDGCLKFFEPGKYHLQQKIMF